MGNALKDEEMKEAGTERNISLFVFSIRSQHCP
jgi:hypothetical protein